MPRIAWAHIPSDVHAAVQRLTGPVSRVDPVPAGRNSDVAAVIHTATGTVFAKGNRAGRHTRTQRLEAAITPHVTAVSPRLLWHVDACGWDLLGFQHVAGRRADLSPGSHDLAKITDATALLGRTPPPDLPLKRIEARWAHYADPDRLPLLAGDTLLHTDLHPDNIITTDADARLVDWAWPPSAPHGSNRRVSACG